MTEAQCSHLTITSRPREQEVAYRARYENGRIQPPGPVACAGNPGTSVLVRSPVSSPSWSLAAADGSRGGQVEDLFYNNPLRKRALRHVHEEYERLAEVVRAYAVANPGVSFLLRRTEQPLPDVRAVGGPAETHRSVLRALVAGLGTNEALLRDLGPAELVPGVYLRGCVSLRRYTARRSKYYFFVNRTSPPLPLAPAARLS